MVCEFGYNCKHYLPTLQKCRKLIDNYRTRKDLAEQIWLGTEDTLVYLNLSNEALIRGVVSDEIAVKQLRRKLKFRVTVASQFDDCALKDSGGACLYFARHSGQTISCLADLKNLDAEHPNKSMVPGESDVRDLEDEIGKILNQRKARPA